MFSPTDVDGALLERMNQFDDRLEYLISIVEKRTSTPAHDESPLLTTRKAADFLGIATKTIYNNPERFKAIKMKDGGLRFRRKDLEELVAVSPE